MFQRFDEIYTHRHDYAKEWKKRMGGRVMGYFCTYAPEEIVYAAYLYVPMNVQSSAAKPYLREELALFKKSLEEWTGKPITDADLDRGIEIVDTSKYQSALAEAGLRIQEEGYEV